ncbi:hypothetical protein [Streptomyces sp. NPDC097619]|uniref:hypothetical protein n=1 Tax=Streptomyces sp. NPDC097619 TaxID=3157228 RepID=UPI0033262A8B
MTLFDRMKGRWTGDPEEHMAAMVRALGPKDAADTALMAGEHLIHLVQAHLRKNERQWLAPRRIAVACGIAPTHLAQTVMALNLLVDRRQLFEGVCSQFSYRWPRTLPVPHGYRPRCARPAPAPPKDRRHRQATALMPDVLRAFARQPPGYQHCLTTLAEAVDCQDLKVLWLAVETLVADRYLEPLPSIDPRGPRFIRRPSAARSTLDLAG